MCLTYCVPLADSLCSFVRVQHVFAFFLGFFCLFVFGGGCLLVFRKDLYGGGDCMYVYECIRE